MLRVVCALTLVLLVAVPGFGQQQSLVGTYKIISQEVVVDGTPTYPLGKAPRGYLVLTPTRAVFFFTAADRKFGTSAAEKAALLDTLVAYSGTYRVEGSKMMITGDASWTEVFTGKNQIRNFTVSGNRLTLRGEPEPFPRDPSKTAIVVNVWERIE